MTTLPTRQPTSSGSPVCPTGRNAKPSGTISYGPGCPCRSGSRSASEGRGEALEDLYQVAAVGLVKAVDHYDPERGAAFEAYAVPTVTGEIKRHFRDHLWALHVPRRVQDLRNRVRTASKELSATVSGRPPTVAEIAAYAQLSESEVRAGMEALECFSVLSLEAELPRTDGYALTDTVGGADPGFDLIVDRTAVGPCLRALPERERTILYLRFFGGMTQSRIASQLGISQMHVSRLLSTCCARIREELDEESSAEQSAERSEGSRTRHGEMLADACSEPADPVHATVAR